eukprot:scaffold32195_cov65-Phaeocystis_antarctica.AAC.2
MRPSSPGVAAAARRAGRPSRPPLSVTRSCEAAGARLAWGRSLRCIGLLRCLGLQPPLAVVAACGKSSARRATSSGRSGGTRRLCTGERPCTVECTVKCTVECTVECAAPHRARARHRLYELRERFVLVHRWGGAARRPVVRAHATLEADGHASRRGRHLLEHAARRVRPPHQRRAEVCAAGLDRRAAAVEVELRIAVRRRVPDRRRQLRRVIAA